MLTALQSENLDNKPLSCRTACVQRVHCFCTLHSICTYKNLICYIDVPSVQRTFRKDTLRIMGHSCRTHMPQACTDWWKPVTTVCHNNASLYTYIPMEFIRPRQSTVVRPCSGYAWQPPGLYKELFDHNEATVSVNALNGLDRRLSFLQGKHQDMGRAIVGRHA